MKRIVIIEHIVQIKRYKELSNISSFFFFRVQEGRVGNLFKGLITLADNKVLIGKSYYSNSFELLEPEFPDSTFDWALEITEKLISLDTRHSFPVRVPLKTIVPPGKLTVEVVAGMPLHPGWREIHNKTLPRIVHASTFETRDDSSNNIWNFDVDKGNR